MFFSLRVRVTWFSPNFKSDSMSRSLALNSTMLFPGSATALTVTLEPMVTNSPDSMARPSLSYSSRRPLPETLLITGTFFNSASASIWMSPVTRYMYWNSRPLPSLSPSLSVQSSPLIVKLFKP